MEYYVYTYLDENNEPYYVGMGKGRRYKVAHLYVDVPKSTDNIVMENNLTQQQAWDLEIKLIAKHGRLSDGTGILHNLTNGGKTQKSGWNHSKQAKTAISKANTGKVRTSEHKKNYSGPKTAEHSENIRLANLGREDDGRYIKMGITMSKNKWYNNGIITKFCQPGKEPAGFVPGRISWKKVKA